MPLRSATACANWQRASKSYVEIRFFIGSFSCPSTRQRPKARRSLVPFLDFGDKFDFSFRLACGALFKLFSSLSPLPGLPDLDAKGSSRSGWRVQFPQLASSTLAQYDLSMGSFERRRCLSEFYAKTKNVAQSPTFDSKLLCNFAWAGHLRHHLRKVAWEEALIEIYRSCSFFARIAIARRTKLTRRRSCASNICIDNSVESTYVSLINIKHPRNFSLAGSATLIDRANEIICRVHGIAKLRCNGIEFPESLDPCRSASRDARRRLFSPVV